MKHIAAATTMRGYSLEAVVIAVLWPLSYIKFTADFATWCGDLWKLQCFFVTPSFIARAGRGEEFKSFLFLPKLSISTWNYHQALLKQYKRPQMNMVLWMQFKARILHTLAWEKICCNRKTLFII